MSTTDPTPTTGTSEGVDDVEAPVVIAVNVVGDQVGAGWGRARTVALATVLGGRIVSWDEEDVRWDLSHDQTGEGRHHADIVRFLREHGVHAVVTGHMGPPMANTLQKLGVLPLVNATGDAREAALAGAAFVAEHRAGHTTDEGDATA